MTSFFFVKLSFCFQAFNVVFSRAIERSEASEDLKERVFNLIDTTTYSVFQYTTRGLFECDKLTFTAQVAMQVTTTRRYLPPTAVHFLCNVYFTRKGSLVIF